MRAARLASGVWIAAHIRRVEIAGASAMVARRGDADAGAIALKLAHLGLGMPPQARALSQATLGDGALGWIWLVGPEPAPEREADQALARLAAFDPDLWILEIEDRDGRPFVAEPIAS